MPLRIDTTVQKELKMQVQHSDTVPKFNLKGRLKPYLKLDFIDPQSSRLEVDLDIELDIKTKS